MWQEDTDATSSSSGSAFVSSPPYAGWHEAASA